MIIRPDTPLMWKVPTQDRIGTPADGNPPFGFTADQFIKYSIESSVKPLITIPMVGYVPFDRTSRCSFSVAKYGPQQRTDPGWSDCGIGIRPDGSFITGNDLRDANKPIDESYILKWLSHIDDLFGRDTVTYFALDNEPGLWHETHRDVHPSPLTYDELWNKTVLYASTIKKYYPNAKIFGPVPWGWCEYMFSSADACKLGPDRSAHGDLPQLEWYIKQIGQYKASTGIQLIDVIDIHYYPSTANVAFDNDEDDLVVSVRFRSTRGLWDPNYIEDSWVLQPIYMIPRVQQWINQYTPGLPIAITEYNWGGDNLISGALAQVIILGIFARENVWAATRWIVPDPNTKTEESFKIFTNYDGKGASVQGDSVSVSVDNTEEVEAFGFVGKTGYVVLVNKRGDGVVPVSVDVSSFTVRGTVAFYSFSASQSLSSVGTSPVVDGKVSVRLNAWSALLAVISF